MLWFFFGLECVSLSQTHKSDQTLDVRHKCRNLRFGYHSVVSMTSIRIISVSHVVISFSRVFCFVVSLPGLGVFVSTPILVNQSSPSTHSCLLQVCLVILSVCLFLLPGFFSQFIVKCHIIPVVWSVDLVQFVPWVLDLNSNRVKHLLSFFFFFLTLAYLLF